MRRLVLILVIVAVLGLIAGGGWWYMHRNTGPRLLARSRLALRAKEYDRAIELARSYTAEAPKDWRGYYFQARGHAALGRYEKARALLNDAAEVAPDETDIVLMKAETFVRPARETLASPLADLSVEEIGAAIEQLTRARQVLREVAPPGEDAGADTTEALGLILSDLGSARKTLQRRLEREAQTAEKAGAEFQAKAKRREAEEAGAKADQDWKQAAGLLIRVLRKAIQDREADEGEKASPPRRAANALVRIAIQRDDTDMLKTVRKLILDDMKEDPPPLAATMLIEHQLQDVNPLVMAPSDEQRVRDAYDRLSAILEKEPDHPEALQVRLECARLAYLLGNFDRAQEICDTVLQNLPRQREARLYRAMVDLRRGKAGEAEKALFALKTDFPNWPQAHFAYGDAALKAGKRELAREALRRATELAPGHPGARRELAESLLRDGFHKAALEEAQRLWATGPGNPAHLNLVVKAALRAGQAQLAENTLDECLASADASPALLMSAWQGYQRIGKPEKAEAAVFRIVDPVGIRVARPREAAHEGAVRVVSVAPGSPAEEAGLVRVDDLIRSVAGNPTATPRQYHQAVLSAERGGQVAVELVRDEKPLKVQQPVGPEPRPERPQERIAVAMAYYALGDPQKADARLTAENIEHPKDAEFHFARGHLYEKMERMAQAIEQYRKAIELSPNNLRYQERLAQVLLRIGLLEEAESLCTDVLEREPARERASLLLGQIRMMRGQVSVDDVIEELRKGDTPDVQLAQTYLLAGNPERCADICRNLLKAAPDSIEARLILGRAYQALGEHKRAVTQYTEALKADPSDLMKYRWLAAALARTSSPEEAEIELLGIPGARRDHVGRAVGWLLARRRRYDAAAEAFGRVVSHDDLPAYSRDLARWERARCLALAGHLDRAMAELDTLAENKQWSVRARQSQVELLAAAGKTSRAGTVLAGLRSDAVEQGSARLLVWAASLYMRLGRPEEALEVSNSLIELRPNEGAGYRLRAQLLKDLGRLEDTIPLYRKAMEFEPGNLRLRAMLVRAFDALGRPKDALQELQSLSDHSESGRALALIERGFMLSRWGLYDQALDCFQELTEVGYGDVPRIKVGLARVFAGLGRRDRALELLREIPEEASEFVKAQHMVAELVEPEAGQPPEEAKLKVLRDLEAKRPRTSGVLAQRLSILLRAGRADDAVEAFREARQRLQEGGILPLKACALAFRAMLQAERRQEALELSTWLAEKTNAPVWRRMAALMLADTKPEEAIALLPAPQRAAVGDALVGFAVSRTPDQKKAWLNRMETLREATKEALPDLKPPYRLLIALAAGQHEKAKAEAAQFKGLAGSYRKAAVELVVAAGSQPEAIAAEAGHLLRASLAIQFGAPSLGRAWAMEVLKARPACQFAVTLIIQTEPDTEVRRRVLDLLEPKTCLLAQMVRAEVLFEQKAYKEAAELFKTAFEKDPDNAQLLLNQAIAVERSGDLEQALPLYRKVWKQGKITIAANNAAYLISVLYPEDEKKLSEALDLAKGAADAEPGAPPFRDTYGWIAHLLGQNDKAAEELRRAVRGMPNSPEVQYHLGVVEREAGNPQLARWHLEAAVDLADAAETAQGELSDQVAEARRLAKAALDQRQGAKQP